MHLHVNSSLSLLQTACGDTVVRLMAEVTSSELQNAVTSPVAFSGSVRVDCESVQPLGGRPRRHVRREETE